MDGGIVGGIADLGRRGSKEEHGHPSETTSMGDPCQGKDTP